MVFKTDGPYETFRPDLATFEEFDLEMQRRNYCAQSLMPVIEVAECGGRYGLVKLESYIKCQDEDLKRAACAGYSRGDFEFTDRNYGTTEYGKEQPVCERTGRKYRNFLSLEQKATMLAVDAVLNAQEVRVISAIQNAMANDSLCLDVVAGRAPDNANGIEGISPSAKWSDRTNSTPVDDVKAARIEIFCRTGMWANKIVISRELLEDLKFNEQIKETICSNGCGDPTKPSDITKAMLAACFDVDEVMCCEAIKCAEGATPNGGMKRVQSLWPSDQAFVCYSGGDSLPSMSFGNILHWDADDSEPLGHVERYYDITCRTEFVRVRHETDEHVKYPEMGFLLKNLR